MSTNHDELIAEARNELLHGEHLVQDAKCFGLVERLADALESAQKTIRHNALDWAEDDTAIRALCAAHGIDVAGDTHGVPPMVDCVEKLAAKLTLR